MRDNITCMYNYAYAYEYIEGITPIYIRKVVFMKAVVV